MKRANPLRLVEPVPAPRETGPSEAFIRLTRNPDIRPPERVERTAKSAGDVVI